MMFEAAPFMSVKLKDDLATFLHDRGTRSYYHPVIYSNVFI